MANRFVGVNKGQHEVDVVDASSTQTKDLEININLSQSLSREDALVLIEYIRNYILKKQWPLA